jgi:uncharacterized protein TP_0021
MDMDEYTSWKEALLRLPSKTFFDLMRLYLGEIKTPFNKQRLVEKLTGFLSKPSTQAIIVKGIDRIDAMILAAVHILPMASKDTLLSFLSSESAIPARLVNLEERLLLYRTDYTGNSMTTAKVYCINPLLYKAIEPLLDSTALFLPEYTSQVQTAIMPCDDITLIGLYTFFLKETSVLKADGTFKQRIEKQLQTVFQEAASKPQGFELLAEGLQNLGLLLRNEAQLIPQQERWEAFCKYTPPDRKLYIAAAVCGHTRRETLHLRAQFFADFLNALQPEGCYTDGALLRFFDFLLKKQLLESVRDMPLFPGIQSTESKLTIINYLKVLKFLLPTGQYWQLNTSYSSRETAEQPIIAAPSFEVTILPYTAIGSILPVLRCMEPVSVLTTARFTISRAACMRCFAQGDTDKTLTDALAMATGGTLPQNIAVSITEWYLQSTAIGLYHGFVMVAAEEKRKLFKQNQQLQNMIARELADGVYLMKPVDLESIRTILHTAGLDATFYHPAAHTRYTATPLVPLTQHRSFLDTFAACTSEQHRFKQEREYRDYIKELETIADTLPLNQEEKQNVKEKIAKKLIILPEQLMNVPSGTEIREASGLDFLGKIHLAESAITAQQLLELTVDTSVGQQVITGIPSTIEKAENDAILLLQEPGKNTFEKISIARILKMRTLQDSLFS